MKSDKPTKTRRPTVKQERFIKEYAANGGNGTKAALVAYDTDEPRTAQTIASENLSKPMVRREVDLLMRQVGLTTRKALIAVDDAIQATRPSTTTKDGTVIEGGPDHAIRLRSADMTFKLKGAYPSKVQNIDHRHSHLHLVEALDDLPSEEIDAELKLLEEEERGVSSD